MLTNEEIHFEMERLKQEVKEFLIRVDASQRFAQYASLVETQEREQIKCIIFTAGNHGLGGMATPVQIMDALDRSGFKIVKK